MKRILHAITYLLIPAFLCAQSVSPEVISSSGDYFEGSNGSLSWTLGEIATETFSNGNNILTQGFQQPNMGLRLALTCFLEGPYSTGGAMNTTLLSGGYIPTSQPYNPGTPYYGNNSPVWLYGGIETADPVPANVVDWVLVQLRDADAATNATSATIKGMKAGLLLSDGSIVGLDGLSNMSFSGVTITNNLYVVIYHRNHLGIMSNNAVTSSGGDYTYDFSTSVTQVYGGINGHKEIETGVWGLVAADGNGNGLVQNTDEVNVWKVDLGGSGYQAGDFNLNGLTQNTDEVNYWKPNLGGGGQIPLTDANTGYQSQIPK